MRADNCRRVLVLLTCLILLTQAVSVNADAISRQVSASSDDCTSFGGSSFSTTQGYCRVGHDGSNPYAYAMRFTNVTIPSGASISSADIEIRARLTETVQVDFALQGEDTNSAATFSTRTDFDNRAVTSASVNKSQSSWTAGSWYTYDGIATVIQQIVNRSGWSSGNSIVIFITPTSQGGDVYTQWHSYDIASADGAKLNVTYTTGSSVNNNRRRLIINSQGG